MQLRLPWARETAEAPVRRQLAREVVVDGRTFPIDVVRHRWARRYLLRLTEDARLRLTVPRGASIAGGVAFVATETAWIAREWARVQSRVVWLPGSLVWWRGEQVPLALEDGHARCGGDAFQVSDRRADLRTTLQRQWRGLATRELVPRCRDLAGAHGLTPTRVSVRDQRSRWGACSSRGAITLNWRLVQMPPLVADYVILHELAHLEHPNHSRRFWRKVASMCPSWRDAERWLRRHGKELL
ncbi:MAG: M48 family metallopeptidase [Acidobacteria bacterium]|nr:M48 family metallopeptidase [Acidobacteriota bacterium]